MDLVHVKPLSTGQIALWYALMYINNKCAWAEWFTVPNNTLELYTSLSRQGIIKCRNVLKQCGVIDFKSNGTKAASYRLLTMLDSVQTSVQDGILTKTTISNSVQNSIQSSVQNSIHDSVQNSGTLNKLNVNKTKLNKDTSAPVSEIIELYKFICTRLIPVTDLVHASRERVILGLWNIYGDIEVFKTVFTNANSSDFMCGDNKRKWTASLDWLLKQDNFVKVYEGVYSQNQSKSEKASTSYDLDKLDEFWNTVPTLD